MNSLDLQKQYDSIYSFFKTTSEPFDFLEWDGETLIVFLKESKIETYGLKELKGLINDLQL